MYKSISLLPDSALLKPEFTFGVATASFQIEGARDKRLDCIWDTFCEKHGTIADNSHGDVACDHVARWQQDIEMIADLAVDAYRLSISWPRVMQQDSSVNEQGMAFYVQLLSALKARNIKTYVTLYHWDLPQYLEDNGGWLNRETAYKFKDYAELVTQHLGHLVDSFATLNEPFCSAYLGYEVGVHAPGIKSQQAGRQAAHHLLLAHGLAMQVLRKNCPDTEAGIVLNFSPTYPLTADDKKAAELADQYHNQWYIKAVLEGAYPSLLDDLADAVKPAIIAGDMAVISQAVDFIGVNYYTRIHYRNTADNWFEEANLTDIRVTDMGWEVYPQGLTELLVSLHQQYDLPKMYITENGAAMADTLENGEVNDIERVDYYHTHLNAVCDAIRQGVDIQGYFAWSLMDNFEWAYGYEKRFGLVYIDYQSQQRILKESAKQYRALLKQR
ncbi:MULTISPECIES: GH1 family beta-glucosidase [Pseudoalteromonas]|uniref:GH1 family beta-glucosidase n=1 Tax=Pseudoalteromonas TaxID=53246 RepID=UPI001581AA5D|nr:MULTISPECIES: GH1 family beta-glucosidase [Pseudoalteromonas]MDI4653569.1 GH1 family beta-glucosidase [Pseudoalteromonas shioyasakiensis]NUJ39896.1 beta-glucosidase [Pseudoalteromonas sp. 0303]